MIHVSHFMKTSDQQENDRLLRAWTTWKDLIATTGISSLWLWPGEVSRNATAIGEKFQDNMFIKDIIEMAFLRDHTIFFTNSDASICRDSVQLIRAELKEALYSHRRNFQRPPREWLTCEAANKRGQEFVGVDSIIITKKWWLDHKTEVPDLLLGFQGWDWVFKHLILANPLGGRTSLDITYHEYHQPYWAGHVKCPGQLYNRSLCKKWATARTDYKRILTWWPELREFQA